MFYANHSLVAKEFNWLRFTALFHARRLALQFVLQQRVPFVGRSQVLEGRFRRCGSLFNLLIGGYLDGVIIGPLRSVMEFAVQLSTVEIIQKLLQFAWNENVLEVGEQIHMPEGVDCNQR